MNEDLRKEYIDALLDKMSEEGMDSLTPNEKTFMADPNKEKPDPDDVVYLGGYDIIVGHGAIDYKTAIHEQMWKNVDEVNAIFENSKHNILDEMVDFLEKHHGTEFSIVEEETSYMDKEHPILETVIYKADFPNPSVVVTTNTDPVEHHTTLSVYYKLFHQLEAAFPKQTRLMYQSAFEDWIIGVFDGDVHEFATFTHYPEF